MAVLISVLFQVVFNLLGNMVIQNHSLPQLATTRSVTCVTLRRVGFSVSPCFTFPTTLKFLAELNPGEKVQVEVLAVSDEVESPPIRFDISWDGKWSEDTQEMKRHFVVKKVEI
jgi:hypothetical protein